MLTEALTAVCPAGEKYGPHLSVAADRFLITTKLRQAHWLGQLAHESGGFRFVRENLNYNAEGLMRVWPSRFQTIENARRYERDPIRTANFVYSDRMGNGNPGSGDGSRFLGRGLIQLTGRANYADASNALFDDDRLVYHPEDVETPEIAALTAGWFWLRRGLNTLADLDDILAITKKINGGTHGLDERWKWVEKFKAAL